MEGGTSHGSSAEVRVFDLRLQSSAAELLTAAGVRPRSPDTWSANELVDGLWVLIAKLKDRGAIFVAADVEPEEVFQELRQANDALAAQIKVVGGQRDTIAAAVCSLAAAYGWHPVNGHWSPSGLIECVARVRAAAPPVPAFTVDWSL